MIDSLTGTTSALVRVMLDAHLQSQRAAAHNIANVNSDGYEAARVDFNSIYQEAEELLSSKHGSQPERFENLKWQIADAEYLQFAQGSVSLDQEMVKLNEATVQYQALLKAMSKQGSLVKMAINGGQGK